MPFENHQRIGPRDQLKDADMQSPISVTTEARSLRDSRFLSLYQLDCEWKAFPNSTFPKTLSPFAILGHHKVSCNTSSTARLSSDILQEPPAACLTRRRQPTGAARVAKEGLDGREPQAQDLETFEYPAATASLYKAWLPTQQPSQIEIATTRLFYAVERSEGNTLGESEADAGFAPGRRTSGLPCVSPSEGLQIYCASCASETEMTKSYACTQCLRGVCPICVTQLMAKKWTRRRCPWCSADGAQFKPNH